MPPISRDSPVWYIDSSKLNSTSQKGMYLNFIVIMKKIRRQGLALDLGLHQSQDFAVVGLSY